MIKKFLCWLGLHHWLIHKVEPIVHEKYESILYAGCSRCAYSYMAITSWKSNRVALDTILNKTQSGE